MNNFKNETTKMINVAHAKSQNTSMSEKALHVYTRTSKVMVFALMLLMLTCVPCFADIKTATLDGEGVELVEDMIGIILLVFRVIGIFMCFYSIGALVMAFKNEDPDAKMKNASMLVVSLVLIFLQNFADVLDVSSLIGTSGGK